MSIKFQKSFRSSHFSDPFNGFQPTTHKIEIRKDPLAGDVSRLLTYRAKNLPPMDHSGWKNSNPPERCPFCPDNLPRLAARFIHPAAPEGLLHQGEATAMPNAFPYESLSGVIVMCRAHYLAPADFTPQIVADSLGLATKVFAKLGDRARFGSVNWNYLMPAGAGLLHPHMQIAAAAAPTRYQAALLSRARAHARREGELLNRAYLAAEKKAGERYVGQAGPLHFLAAFAPRAIYDVMALTDDEKGLLDFKPAQLKALAGGICKVLAYFQSQNVGSYNLALHTPLAAGTGLPLMLRLVSRVTLPPLQADEINYFEKLHDENLSYLPPEAVALGLKAAWR